MGMGLGHKYLVELIKWYEGTLDQCLKWMENNKPANNLYWFELHPQVQIVKNKRVKCDIYRVDLVTDGDTETRHKF